jgi:hypothetical protein
MGTANSLNIANFTSNTSASTSVVGNNAHFMEFRLSPTTGVPIDNNATAVTTIYMTPFVGNLISLYNGTTWDTLSTAEISIAVPATTATLYDVFCYNNSGTATLELTAWTNDTTRATALVAQDGVLCKTGALTRRWIGCMRTTSVSGQTEDSTTNRLIYNFYNQRQRPLANALADSSWTWSGTYGTWRAANANTTTNMILAISGAPTGYQANCVNLIYKIMTKSSSTNISIIIGIARNQIDPSLANNRGFGSSLNATASPASAYYFTQSEGTGCNNYLPYEYLNGSSDTATFTKTLGLQIGGLVGWVLG